MSVAGWSFTRCSGLCWQGSNIRQKSSEQDGEYGRIFWRVAGSLCMSGVLFMAGGVRYVGGSSGRRKVLGTAGVCWWYRDGVQGGAFQQSSVGTWLLGVSGHRPEQATKIPFWYSLPIPKIDF